MVQTALPDHEFGFWNKVIQYNEFVGAGFFNTPVSDSENLGLGLIQGAPGSYSFVEFANAEGATTRIDWRGTVNNVTTVLRWAGPNGRYRQFGPSPALAPRDDKVYRNGVLHAQAPKDVVAASITTAFVDEDFGDVPLLHVIARNFADDFFVYRKPFGAASDDTSLFDPDTNPTGWKQIGDELLFPTDADIGLWQNKVSALFFNESGTKARGMIPVTTEFNGVTPPDFGRQIEIEIEITVDDSTLTSLGINGANSVDRQDQQICNTTASGTTTTSSENTNIDTFTRVFSDGFKIFVDFKGDTPVYANWSREDIQLSSTASTSFTRGATDLTSTLTEDSVAHLLNKWTLDIAGISLPIQGFTRTVDIDDSREGTVGGPLPCSVNLTQSTNTVLFDVVLQYADMRYDLVVYRQIETIEDDVTTASGNPCPSNQTTGTNTLTTEITEKMVIRFDGADNIIFQDDDTDVVVSSGGTVNCCPINAQCCSPDPNSSCSTDVTTDLGTVSEFASMLDLDDEESVGGINVDVSFDGDILFYSERPLDEWFSLLDDTPESFENFLTGGDPVDVTGLTGDNPRFQDIRLMR